MHWSCAGMSVRFFLDMDSSGLWSDSIVKTIHRHKCRIALLQRQMLASLSLCLHICILHWWVLCLQKPWVCYSVGVLHLDLPGKHPLVWSQAVMGQSIWGWCCWQWLAWLAQRWPHLHSSWSRHLFQKFLQRSSQGGQATDEGAEVCHHAKELLEFGDICGCWESMHSINLLWIWVDTIGII